MSRRQQFYYPNGSLGHCYLSISNTLYSHSQLLYDRVIQLIECDIKEKWMKVKTKSENNSDWDELNLDELQKKVTIDLSEKGDRWEGDSLNGVPFGYGCIYDDENQLVYKGFVYEGKKVCYGTEFYGDVGFVEYEGGFYNGTRYGCGKLYDKKNELIYEGEWYMNNPIELSKVEINEELKQIDIHFDIEELSINNSCTSELKHFLLIGFGKLKRLYLGRECFRPMEVFHIENCNELIDVRLGDDNEQIVYKHNKHDDTACRIFVIKNCELLKELMICDDIYAKCDKFELDSKY